MKRSSYKGFAGVYAVARQLQNSSIFWWIFAVLFYGLLTAILMGTAITSFADTVYGYSWDGTGGLAWFQWADGGLVPWGFTDKSNFPFGEQLNRQQFITAYGLFLPYSLIATLTNQICALNIMTALGFISTALLMFGIVRWLTRSNGAALFAGLAAAFVPFHQLQAQGHLSYIYSSIFIAIIWAFLWFIQKPSVPRVLLVSVLYTFSLYMDGYFVLLSTLLIIVLFTIFILKGVFNLTGRGILKIEIHYQTLWINIRTNFKLVVVAMVSIGILLTPIAYVQLKHGNEIQSSLSSARSDIKSDASAYSGHMSDYFLPSIRSALVSDDYAKWRTDNFHFSNQYESTLYVGYVIILLALFVVLIPLFANRFKQWDLNKYKPAIVVGFVLVVVFVLLSLPPQITIGNFDIATPSQLLIDVTSKWRVLARFFMITHVAIVLLAAIGLALVLKNLMTKWKWVILIAVILITSVEFYQTRTPNWSYAKDTPAVYNDIAKDDSIHVIAEYPITDFPSQTLPYTFTFQQYHGKKLINANESSTNQRQLRQSIAGLADTQTLGVLKTLGADMVTTLGIDASGINGLDRYKEPSKTIVPSIDKVYSYRLGNIQARDYALVTHSGFITTLNYNLLKSSSAMFNGATLTIDPVGRTQNVPGKIFNVKFNATAYGNGAQQLTIMQRGVVVWKDVVQTNTLVDFKADNKDPIILSVDGFYSTPSLYLQDLMVNS